MDALREPAARSRVGTRRARSGPDVTGATVMGVVDGKRIDLGDRLVVGRYRIRSMLGRGGMGVVWLADDELLERPVALKQVTTSRPASQGSCRAARVLGLHEARAAARVHHDAVVAIYDLVRDDGCPWIIMELLSGRTLAEALEADGPLSVPETTEIGMRLLDALQATHQAGVIHGDVKPGNVHLCHGDRVVLGDFGVASSHGSDVGPGAHTFAGSPAYASPERLRREPSGTASDLFSLGATLFAAIEGRSPFDRPNLWATLAAVSTEAPAPFRRAGRLRPVIEGLLAKEPDRRLTAAQARAALRAVQR